MAKTQATPLPKGTVMVEGANVTRVNPMDVTEIPLVAYSCPRCEFTTSSPDRIKEHLAEPVIHPKGDQTWADYLAEARAKAPPPAAPANPADVKALRDQLNGSKGQITALQNRLKESETAHAAEMKALRAELEALKATPVSK